MQLISELSKSSPPGETLLTIGVFDGVHLGHRHLISRLTQRASEANLISGVVTFNVNPKAVLSPRTKLARLTTLEEKARLLKSLGVGLVIPITFNTDVAALSAREFVLYLKKYLKMRGLIIGPNFALGRGREGNAAVLQSLGRELDFTVEVVKPLLAEGSLVSSTAIRRALAKGDMNAVTGMLGRYFSVGGEVITGEERGRVLGFPTANIDVDSDQALPEDGVYATLARLGNKLYQSATNIGVKPTFGGTDRMVEAFIFDFTGDLYGKKMTLEFVERLRSEIKFAGPEELSAQIKKDVERARTILKKPLAGAKHVS